ncbi:MAG TPA: hypothetical protein PKA95_10575 [Thermomicrobiales bacterium]|nr:hypothetical protein [Thermomicrobiales bacterium]
MTGSGEFEPDLTLWDAWRPAEVARLFSGIDAPWYVAAGWAIDLFLGYQRREHGDLEVAVPHDRFGELMKALDGFEVFVPVSGPGNWLVWPFDRAGELAELHHQTWVREPSTGRWRLDVFREPGDGDTWICRRDERIRLPYRDLIQRTADGIPYLRPEVNLLFKAKWSDLEKNKTDFAAVLPRLDPARRRWLAEALAIAHPGHPWIATLGE